VSWDREAPNPYAPIQRRLKIATFLISGAMLFLLLRLWHLQMIEGDRLRQLSINNRLRIRPVEALRGFVVDRHGEPIVENRASFDLYVTPQDMANVEETMRRLARVLQMEPDELRERLAQRQIVPSQPVLLRKGIDERMAFAIEEQKLELPGVTLRVRPVRAYPTGGLAATLLGYVSEVSDAQLKSREFQDFRPGETMGQAGIERRYDAFIRGIDGGEQVEVDARGRLTRLVQRVEPRSGFNLHLTLDGRIQRVAEESFRGKSGALLAMNPSTGEILAMVSQPAYDPNQFSRHITPEQWRALVSDPKHPMQNRGLQGQYAPGSIFKLVTALAALEKGAIEPDTKFSCNGSFALGSHTFQDWKKGGHGTLDLLGGIANSCNIYFYNAALKTGVEEIARVAKELGLGAPPGMGLDEEAKGVIPSPESRQSGAAGWYPGNTVMAGIGQGMVTVTPMQVLIMVSAIANGGTIYRPWVVRRVETLDREAIEEYGPEIIRKVGIDPSHLAVVRQGMQGVVSEGTGGRARIPGLAVAGKTGTAQVVRKGGPPKGDHRDHAWFVAFAPATDPQIAVVVLVEHAGFGGAVAAPIAKTVLEAWFSPGKRPMPVQTAERQPAEGD
jgi:penicillin-binding protein 2